MSVVIVGIGAPCQHKSAYMWDTRPQGYLYLSLTRAVDAECQRERVEPRLYVSQAYYWLQVRAVEIAKKAPGLVLDLSLTGSNSRHRLVKTLRAGGVTNIKAVVMDSWCEQLPPDGRAYDILIPPEKRREMHQRLLAEPPRLEEGFDSMFHAQLTH